MMIYLELFLTFFKIGLFTFGGGYAMLPLITSEVTSRNWITLSEITDFIAVSESTPGVFAVNISTYIGSQLGGVFGAFCATAGAVLPSFIVILLVARIYDKFQRSKVVKGCMYGLKPVVVGLITSTLLTLVRSVLFGGTWNTEVFTGLTFWLSVAIAAVMIVLVLKKVKPVKVIILSAVVGIVLGFALDLPV